MNAFIDDNRRIDVDYSCDVAVAGGGFAGIAAALSAARAGAKVILLEREFCLGGLATLGLVTIYLPLCDGFGRQVSFGLAEELMRLSVSMDEDPDVFGKWRKGLGKGPRAPRLICDFNPHAFAILAEQLLIREGVKIIYGVHVSGASVRDGKINALIFEGTDGTHAIGAKSFVDASGDAVLCRISGEDTETNPDKNLLAAWYYSSDKTGYVRHLLGASDIPMEDAEPEEGFETRARYDVLSCDGLSDFNIAAHGMLWNDFISSGKLSDGHQISTIPGIPQVRMTRRLSGVTTFDEPEGDYRCDDSIGMISNWKRRGPVYEIPFSCLYGRKVRNLITAGRCISTEGAMWDNTRVIPACAVTGEAAGLAAAMSDDFPALPAAELQKRLAERGIPLHI